MMLHVTKITVGLKKQVDFFSFAIFVKIRSFHVFYFFDLFRMEGRNGFRN